MAKTKASQINNKSTRSILVLKGDRLRELIDTHNLIVKVLKEANKIGISLHSDTIEESLKILAGKEEIYNYIDNKNKKKYLEEQTLQLFTIDQVINQENTHMLIWKKLRNLRDEKGAGKIPEWFKDIERELLANEKSRELKKSYLKKTSNF